MPTYRGPWDAGAVRAYLDRMGLDISAYDPTTAEFAGRDVVSPAAARQLRLEHARRLEADVRQQTTISAD